MMESGYVPDLPPREARMWAMWCHLAALSGLVIPIPFANIIVPFIIWTMKKDQDPFIDEQGRESLNFQISLLIYGIISGILILVVVGIILLPVVYIFGLICVIIAAIRANDGADYRYPLTIRLI
jgi:hypothetical protein